MLKAKNLKKRYTNTLAVDDISLEIQQGKIFGMLGPNGAGKSTTIRMLLNIIQPDEGVVTYNGEQFHESLRNIIGYLPEERGLYKKNKIIDVILYFALLKGMQKNVARNEAMKWLERFELHNHAKRKVEELSKGNQQKIQFITAILHNPQIVVLDEPFSGLDPLNQVLLKEILQELKQQGKAIIFSTHQMESAEKLCDELCLINKGKIVLEGTLKTIKQQFGKNALHLEYEGNAAFLSSLPFIEHAMIYENYAECTLKENPTSQEILNAISPKLELRKFEFVEPSLNTIFMQTIGNTKGVSA